MSDWPWCPHEQGAAGAVDDTFIGGRWVENLGHEPVFVESRSHLQRELKARGLVEFVRHVPVPGSDKSPHTTSWASVDLDAAKALAERQAHTKYISPGDQRDPVIMETIKQVREELRARS